MNFDAIKKIIVALGAASAVSYLVGYKSAVDNMLDVAASGDEKEE